MKRPSARDIPPWAAIAVIALVLLASVVTGRDETPVPAAPTDPRAASVPSTSAPDVGDLDVDKLRRPRPDEKIGDLLAPRRPPLPAVVVQPVLVKPEPVAPRAPKAPPLPFKYLGKYVGDGRLLVFFSRNGDTYGAAQGEAIDNTYRIDDITDAAVTFNYLPLGTQQILPIPAEPELPPGIEISIALPTPRGAADAGPSPINQGNTAVTSELGLAKFSLHAPPQIAAGEEFVVEVSIDSEVVVRAGALNFAFDPSRLRFIRAQPGPLLSAEGAEHALHADAPENMGRLNVTFDSKADVKGPGIATRLLFQAAQSAVGTPSLRLESLTVTDGDNHPISGQLPPPVRLAVRK